MSRPRVLVLAHNHPALVPGGTEIAAHDLFEALAADGRVRPVFVGCVTRLHRAPVPGTALQAIGGSADELLLWTGAYDRFTLSRLEPEPFVRALAELLAEVEPDVVHLHHLDRLGAETLAILRRLRPRVRIVLTLHDYQPICAADGLMVRPGDGTLCRAASPDACRGCFPTVAPERFRLRRLHLLGLLGRVDAFLAPSRFLLERYAAWGLPRERLVLVPNAVPEAAPLPPPAPELRARFGYFGNIVPHKGILPLLEAARRAAAGPEGSTLRLTLNGGLHFPEDGFCAAFAAALDAAAPLARHAGPYARDELSARLAGVGWVVVPSTWWENAPLVVLEAFRHGRPVIASGLGGLAELVRDGASGLLVPPGDPAALADALLRAAHEPGLWERLRAGLPRVPTLAEWVERHLAVYAAVPAREARCA